jgi:hypothetical protein
VSTYGPSLETYALAPAPGSSIYSTWTNSGYTTISGTSMATPHVAGLAGLLASHGLSHMEIRQRLCETADPIAGTGVEWRCGRVHAARAVVASSTPADGPDQRITPAISWPTPAAIVFGSPLSSAQLNARVAVPGSMSYYPGAGSVLNAGSDQLLSVVFTPDDPTRYTNATASVLLTVVQAEQFIRFDALTDQAAGEATLQLIATASSGLAVSFSTTAASSCVVAGQTLTLTGAGSCTVRATQAGNENYHAAAPVEQTFLVRSASDASAPLHHRLVLPLVVRSS